jgi:hypothetical protein
MKKFLAVLVGVFGIVSMNYGLFIVLPPYPYTIEALPFGALIAFCGTCMFVASLYLFWTGKGGEIRRW